MARLGRTAIVAFLALATVACGSRSVSRRGETSYGRGADEVWVFRAADGPPRSVVVFVHGHGGPLEDTPKYHRAWLRHLAARGDAVLYPRYELVPGDHDTVTHIVNAVRTGMKALGNPRVPVIGIGYSRGGRLVMDWAARASGTAFAPRALLSSGIATRSSAISVRRRWFAISTRGRCARTSASRWCTRTGRSLPRICRCSTIQRARARPFGIAPTP